MSMRRPAGFISANYDPLKNPNAPTGVSASSGDASASNATRGLFAGGNTGVATNVIQYITIASTGNATTFGSLGYVVLDGASASSAHGGL